MDKQHKQQIKYFDKEFGEMKLYRLAAWQKSYIKRIKDNMLDKNIKNKKLLDIATGSGYVAIEMAKLGMEVIACDLSPEAIRNLQRYKKQFHLKNLKLIICKAEAIPLRDKSVDYITANAILEHIPEEKAAILEWKRVLKKDGKIFITVPLKLRYIWPFLWLPNMIHDKRIGHLRRYDLASLKKKFKLRLINHCYTGHLIKVFGILMAIILKTDKYDSFFEEQDKKRDNTVYGANNIIVVFANDKK